MCEIKLNLTWWTYYYGPCITKRKPGKNHMYLTILTVPVSLTTTASSSPGQLVWTIYRLEQGVEYVRRSIRQTRQMFVISRLMHQFKFECPPGCPLPELIGDLGIFHAPKPYKLCIKERWPMDNLHIRDRCETSYDTYYLECRLWCCFALESIQ